MQCREELAQEVVLAAGPYSGQCPCQAAAAFDRPSPLRVSRVDLSTQYMYNIIIGCGIPEYSF